MSRGLGRLQRALLGTILKQRRPLTFAEIRKMLPLSVERSLRRALHGLVERGGLITIGEGGPADPYRYYFNPMAAALMCHDTAEYGALMEPLKEATGPIKGGWSPPGPD